MAWKSVAKQEWGCLSPTHPWDFACGHLGKSLAYMQQQLVLLLWENQRQKAIPVHMWKNRRAARNLGDAPLLLMLVRAASKSLHNNWLSHPLPFLMPPGRSDEEIFDCSASIAVPACGGSTWQAALFQGRGQSTCFTSKISQVQSLASCVNRIRHLEMCKPPAQNCCESK